MADGSPGGPGGKRERPIREGFNLEEKYTRVLLLILVLENTICQIYFSFEKSSPILQLTVILGGDRVRVCV